MILNFEAERKILEQALDLGDKAAKSQGLKLHSLAVGLKGDPPGRVRFSIRDRDTWDEPMRPGWRLASEVRRYCGLQ